jgi:hypothetical protein
MASGIFYPAVSGDDGHTGNSSGYDNSSNNALLGLSSSSARHIWVRFANVTIPANSIVTSAFVTFTAFSSNTDAITVDCYFNDIDDAIAPINESEFAALDLTAAIGWADLPNWTDGSTYDTPELKTILQTVIDRAGWYSGQAIQVAIKRVSGSYDDRRSISSIDYLAGAEKAELHVSWDPPTAQDDTASWNDLDIGSNVTVSLATDFLTATHA